MEVTLGLSNDSNIIVTGATLQEGEKLLVKKAVAKQTNSNRMGPPMH